MEKISVEINYYLQSVLKSAAAIYGYETEDLKTLRNRKKNLVASKRLYCILANELKPKLFKKNIPYSTIGELIDLSHSNVIHHINKANEFIYLASKYKSNEFTTKYNLAKKLHKTIEIYVLQYKSIDLINVIKTNKFLSLEIINESF